MREPPRNKNYHKYTHPSMEEVIVTWEANLDLTVPKIAEILGCSASWAHLKMSEYFYKQRKNNPNV